MNDAEKHLPADGKVRKIILIVCVICAAVCITLLCIYEYRNHQMNVRQEQEGSEIRSARSSDNDGSTEPEDTAEPAAEEDAGASETSSEDRTAPEEPVYPEVAQAQETNPEVFGTLEFGDGILVYTVQTDDNSFYLTHGWDGQENREGAAFLDHRCSQYPRSTNWIIHGHNMKSGAVFGTLLNFRDLDFLREHPIVTLTLLHEKEYYVPYAVLDINVDPDGEGFFRMSEFDFESDEDFEAYTGYLTDHSYYSLPTDVRPDDSLLMLSTCSYGYSNGRLVICLRKLREGETPDSAAELMQKAQRSRNPIVD